LIKKRAKEKVGKELRIGKITKVYGSENYYDVQLPGADPSYLKVPCFEKYRFFVGNIVKLGLYENDPQKPFIMGIGGETYTETEEDVYPSRFVPMLYYRHNYGRRNYVDTEGLHSDLGLKGTGEVMYIFDEGEYPGFVGADRIFMHTNRRKLRLTDLLTIREYNFSDEGPGTGATWEDYLYSERADPEHEFYGLTSNSFFWDDDRNVFRAVFPSGFVPGSNTWWITIDPEMAEKTEINFTSSSLPEELLTRYEPDHGGGGVYGDAAYFFAYGRGYFCSKYVAVCIWQVRLQRRISDGLWLYNRIYSLKTGVSWEQNYSMVESAISPSETNHWADGQIVNEDGTNFNHSNEDFSYFSDGKQYNLPWPVVPPVSGVMYSPYLNFLGNNYRFGQNRGSGEDPQIFWAYNTFDDWIYSPGYDLSTHPPGSVAAWVHASNNTHEFFLQVDGRTIKALVYNRMWEKVGDSVINLEPYFNSGETISLQKYDSMAVTTEGNVYFTVNSMVSVTDCSRQFVFGANGFTGELIYSWRHDSTDSRVAQHKIWLYGGAIGCFHTGLNRWVLIK
jgi:hypothetical protein